MNKTLKTYEVTFWRSNPQLANGGYEKKEIMRGIDKEHVWARAMKKDRNCVYGGYYPTDIALVEAE